MIDRIRTDLPVPEPPTTPSISPRLTARSRSSCTTCSPKLFFSPVTSMMGCSSAISGPADLGEEDREECIEDDDEEDALDDRGGGPEADLLGIALDLKTLEAARHGDDQTEDRRLDQGLPKIGHRHDFAGALDEGDRRDAQRDPA